MMASNEPATDLEPQFSSAGATPTAWAEAVRHLEQAALFWLSTVRPDGRPHVTPPLAVWLDSALYFCTGEGERKAKNLVANTRCVLTTGCNTLNTEGLDLVVEGEAVRVVDGARLLRIADAYEAIWCGVALRRARRRLPRRGGQRRHRLRGRAAHGVRLRQGRRIQPDPLAFLAMPQAQGTANG